MLFRRRDTIAAVGSDSVESKPFGLPHLSKLVYPHRVEAVKRIIGPGLGTNRFFPDLLASLMQSMYEQGYAERRSWRMALLSCKYHLELASYEFLGYLVKDSEVSKEESRVPFIACEYDIDGDEPYTSSGISFEELVEREFGSPGAQDPVILFVAGCQNSSMLNYRIKKAALVCTALIRLHGHNRSALPVVYLSGGNNAASPDSSVYYPDESRHMKNLLIANIQREVLVDTKFFDNVHVDTESRSTKENIKHFLAFLKGRLSQHQGVPKVLLTSSSFHLLQIEDTYGKLVYGAEADSMFRNVQTYLLGTENPGHFFKTYDAGYLKLLFQEVFFRNRVGILRS